MPKHGLALVPLLAVLTCPLRAQVGPQPLNEDEVRDLIKQDRTDPDAVFKALDARGVSFDLDRQIEKKMRKAGADDAMLQAIWKAGPTVKKSKTALLTSAIGKSLEASYEEAMGFQTLQNEENPARKLRMVEEFAGRFPQSALLSYVYTHAARACQEQSDAPQALEYGDKSLKLDPDNIYSMLIVALVEAQPNQPGDLSQITRRLNSADSYANRSLILIDTINKFPNETDDQFRARKAALASDAHAALGMVEMQRDKMGKAIEDFKVAISLSVRPNPQFYFRLGEIYENDGKNTEAIEAFSKAAELAQGSPLGLRAGQRAQKLKLH